MIKKLLGRLSPSFVMLSLFSLAGLSFVGITYNSPVKKKIISGDRVNILLLGISETDNARFAEVIKLISYEPVTGFIDLISIPRDTMMPVDYEVTWKRIQKADEIYSRFWRHSDSTGDVFRKFKLELQEYMEGYFNIDYYIQLDYDAFRGLIDALGGVKVEVMENMDYDDNAQDLHIHISTGIRVMDGEKALKYVRYRDKIHGDIGRQERQHLFLQIVLEKIKDPLTFPKIPQLITTMRDNIDTNLSFYDILVIADEIRNFSMKNFRIQKLPGEPVIKWGKSYWKVDREGLKEVLDVVKNSSLINLPNLSVDRDVKITSRITAEVWNATNKEKLARNLTEYLRRRNVDVVRFGNYGANKKYTQIISRTGDLKPARQVSRLIGCRNIKTELDSDRMVDINIVIGNDFEPLWKE